MDKAFAEGISMRNRNISAISFGIYLSATAISNEATAQDVRFMSLRGVADIPSGLRTALATASAPIWRTIESEGGSTLRRVVSEVCGEQPEGTWEFVLEEAKRLNGISELDDRIEYGVAVAVPFCLEVRQHSAAAERTDRLPESVVPWASSARILAARSDAEGGLPEILENTDFESVFAEVENSAVPAESSPDRQPYEFRIVEPVEFETIPENCEADSTVPPIVDIALLNERFVVEEELKETADTGPAQRTVVGMIDSGLAEVGDAFFKLGFFAANVRERDGVPDSDDDQPANNFKDDVYGINFNTRNGEIKPYPTSGAIGSHGTKMAALVLGGPTVATRWTGVRPDPIIRLKIVNFASSTVIGANVGPEYLAEAIEYLVAQGARIINMSLSNGQNLLPVSKAIERNSDRLFVVAAGNAKVGPGRNLDLPPLVFPARYGGRNGAHRDHVITVGAFDNSGQRAEFSNFSHQYVDLLAPGCSVETRDQLGETARDSGTSPATAITSFASALIASLGLEDSRAIKNRLLTSTDFEPGLHGTSWSSGRLNIIKAISLRSDVVQLASDDYLFGKITEESALKRYCEDQNLRSLLTNLKRVIPNITGSDGPEVEYWTEVDGILERIRCSQSVIADGVITVSDGNQGPSITEVQDITFSAF